jgi:hypothetical protein
VISPLLVKPFLALDPEKIQDMPKVPVNSTEPLQIIEYGTLNNNTVVDLNSQPLHITASPLLFVPFTIGGVVPIIGGILILVLFRINKYQSPNKMEKELKAVAGRNIQGSSGCCGCSTKQMALIALSALFLGVYQGMELCSIQFLPTFTHFIDLGLTKQEGAAVLTGLTGAFTLGRALGILIVLRVLPEILLLTNLILIVIGNSTLFFLANSSLPFLWGASVILGAGFSTVFPSFYGYIEKHLKISNVIGAVMIVVGGVVGGLYPVIIGSQIQKKPFVLMYTNFFSVFVGTSCFLAIFAITKVKKGKIYDAQAIPASVEEQSVDDMNSELPLKSN